MHKYIVSFWTSIIVVLICTPINLIQLAAYGYDEDILVQEYSNCKFAELKKYDSGIYPVVRCDDIDRNFLSLSVPEDKANAIITANFKCVKTESNFFKAENYYCTLTE